MNFDHITQEKVQQFIDSGADINTTGSYNGNKSYTLLHAAIDNGDIESVKLILSKNPNLNALVANYGPIEDVRHDIAGGDDEGESDNDQSYCCYSPLHIAAYNNQMEIVKLLLSHGADVNIKIDECHSVLNTAIKTANIELIKLLVESGADVSHISSFRVEPEEEYDDFEDDPRPDLEGLTPLHEAIKAAQNVNYQIVEYLLQQGAKVDCKTSSDYYIKYSPLCLAIKLNRFDLVKLLISYGAEIKDNGMSITLALKLKKFDFAKFLIKVGFDVNDPTNEGDSQTLPLTEAIDNNYVEMVELLIINGADMLSPIAHDNCALDIGSSPEVYNMLTEHIVKVRVLKKYAGELENVDLSSSKIEGFDDDGSRELKCKEELEKMQREFIGTSSLSYYELLKKNIYQLGMYAKNPSIAEILSGQKLKENFPIYGGIIKNCFEKGVFRKELLEQVEKQLNDILSKIPYSVVVEVFTYLKNDDLKHFIVYLNN